MAETIEGVVERIAYRSDEDWSVMRVKLRSGKSLATVVGHATAQPGQRIRAVGEWKNHPSYGLQFSATSILAEPPVTRAGILRYLSSGVIPGVGPATAQAMVEAFGDDTLRVLDEEPERVTEVRGIGEKKAERIRKAWEEHREVSRIMTALAAYEVPLYLCRRIWRQYGDKALSVLREDPFRLALEVSGIGFKTADRIASGLGLPKHSPMRIRAGLVYALHEATGAGHCGQPRATLVQKAVEILGVEPDKVQSVLEGELAGEYDGVHLVQHGDVIYPVVLARCEERTARTLLAMAREPVPWRIDPEKAIAEAEAALNFTLAPQQREGVRMMLTHRVSVLTGGPGVGKTTVLNVLIWILRRHGVEVHLAAPTGKAAQRAAEVTGIPASTVHRLLKLRGPGVEPEEIDEGVVIIDEASMIDTYLMHQIVKAVSGVPLILVGDVDQLPSVGPGQVLSDIIASGQVPVTRLTEVFRQAAGSLIIRNAHRINRGMMPEPGRPDDDFFFLDVPDRAADGTPVEPSVVGERIAQTVCDLVADRLPARFGFDPVRDIMVLSPMNITTTGVGNLNALLQRRLNPDPPRAVTRFGVRFGVGDKVIQTRNNYALEIFNGDVGIVRDINEEESEITVDFSGALVRIPFDEMDALRLAYAITIHKSQGSQAEAVVIPVTTQHYTMLQRNLYYTGVTRAKKLVVMVGQKKALAMAVKRDPASARVTRLRDLLEHLA